MAKSAKVRDLEQSLWMQDNAAMQKVRTRWFNELSFSASDCKLNGRIGDPKQGFYDPNLGQRDSWDSSFLHKSLNLELFYPPKRCLEIMTDFWEQKIADCKEESYGKKDGSDLTANFQVLNVGNFREHKGDVFMPCTLEFTIKNPQMDRTVYDDMGAKLIENGIKFQMAREIMPPGLVVRNRDVYYHAIDAILVNPPIRDFSVQKTMHHALGPMDHSQVAKIYQDDDPKAVDGLRESDMEAFIRSEGKSWEDLPLDGLEEGEDIPSLDKCLPETRAHIQRIYLSYKMGILEEWPSRLEDNWNDHMVTDYGRMSFHLDHKGKGLLCEYGKILGKANSGKGNPGVLLGTRGRLDPEMMRFDYRTPVGFLPGNILRATAESKRGRADIRGAMLQKFTDRTLPRDFSR